MMKLDQHTHTCTVRLLLQGRGHDSSPSLPSSYLPSSAIILGCWMEMSREAEFLTIDHVFHAKNDGRSGTSRFGRTVE